MGFGGRSGVLVHGHCRGDGEGRAEEAGEMMGKALRHEGTEARRGGCAAGIEGGSMQAELERYMAHAIGYRPKGRVYAATGHER